MLVVFRYMACFDSCSICLMMLTQLLHFTIKRKKNITKSLKGNQSTKKAWSRSIQLGHGLTGMQSQKVSSQTILIKHYPKTNKGIELRHMANFK